MNLNYEYIQYDVARHDMKEASMYDLSLASLWWMKTCYLWVVFFTLCIERIVTACVAAVKIYHDRRLLVKVHCCWLL